MTTIAGARAYEPYRALRPGVALARRLLAVVPIVLLAAFYLALAGWVAFGIRLYNNEAMARAVDAWQFFKNGNWNAAGLSLLLPPLPTLLQAPLALIPAFRQDGFAANLVSVAAALVAFVTLNRLLRQLDTPVWVRQVLLAAFALNPLVIFYAVNGASVMLSLALLLLGTLQALKLARAAETPTGRDRWGEATAELPLQPVILLGVCGGLAALARLGGLGLVALWAVLVVGLSRRARLGSAGSRAMLVLYALPVLFLLGLWALAAMLTTGDPVYPLTHLADAALRLGVGDPLLYLETGNAYRVGTPAALAWSYLLLLLWTQPIVLLALAFVLPAARRGLQPRVVLLTTATLIALALTSVMFRRQPVALQDVLPVLPLGLALAGWACGRLRRPVDPAVQVERRTWLPGRAEPRTFGRETGMAVLLMVALAGPVLTAAAMWQADEPGQWPRQFVRALTGAAAQDVWRNERDIATAALEQPGRVLLDDLTGYRIVFLSGRPERFITRADREFAPVLREPVGVAGAALAPLPMPESALEAVGHAYPGLYSNGAAWARLVKAWPNLGWRLFRVSDTPIP